jgi:hypothetical protein
MKTLTILVSILTAMLITSAVLANDADSSRVEKRIIKTIMITDDGKIMKDSTIITENGKVTVHVDSMMIHRRGPEHEGEMRHMKECRMMSGNGEMDDEYEVTVNVEGDSTQTMVIKNPNCKHKVINFEGDSLTRHCKTMIINDTEGMPCPPPPPLPPLPPTMRHFSNQQGMIDLNDPSIISYEKKVQKNGTEKITIIRKLQ